MIGQTCRRQISSSPVSVSSQGKTGDDAVPITNLGSAVSSDCVAKRHQARTYSGLLKLYPQIHADHPSIFGTAHPTTHPNPLVPARPSGLMIQLHGRSRLWSLLFADAVHSRYLDIA